jgi:acetyl esterase/lipase
MINTKILQQFGNAYVLGLNTEGKRNPSMSPLFEDMQKLAKESPFKSLPPALFLCGTEDPLLDDTLLMSVKWLITGSEAIVKIYPGAPHGFTVFPSKDSKDSAAITAQFVQEKLKAVDWSLLFRMSR